MFRALIAVLSLAGLAGAGILYLPPLLALFAMAGFGGFLVFIAALTSAFHRPAEGRDRLLRE